MINFPHISLPDYYTRLLVSNIQNTIQTNNHLEIYIHEHKEMNALVKKIFRDIDPDGFLGKILSISGWLGIRNRLAAVYLEYAMTNKFPESANLNYVTDIINVENKLRHFTPAGNNRAFLLAFYAKMSLIYIKQHSSTNHVSPLIIKDEHIDLMKYSKTKSVRIDWLMFELIQFDHFLGSERVNALLKSETRYEAMFSLLSGDEQEQMMKNCLTYGASIGDTEIFMSDVSQ